MPTIVKNPTTAAKPVKQATKTVEKRFQARKAPASVIVEKTAKKPLRVVLVARDNAVAQVVSGKSTWRDYVVLWRAPDMDKVHVIEAGVPSQFLTGLAQDMKIPQSTISKWTGISLATAKRKLKARKPLSMEDGERALGLAQLVGQVEALVKASGNTEDFNARTWLARWLEEPNPALGGEPPGRYMNTAAGRIIVSDLITLGAGGGYA